MGYYKQADVICNELLEYMSDNYAKDKGYWLWEVMKAIACELSDLTNSLDEIKAKLFVEGLQGDELEDYINNWSYIIRKKQSLAGGYVTFVAKSDGYIPEGTYVAGNNDVNYITTEGTDIVAGGKAILPISCEIYGSIGNCEAGDITKVITSLNFIESVTNTDNITGGQDEESDSELLSRYLEAIKKNANAGNKNHYEELAKMCEGIAEAYCVPCPNNKAGYVDIYVINSEGEQVTAEALEKCQNYIDPKQNGDGSGEAPIGAVATVKNPQRQVIHLEFTPTVENGYNIENIKENIKENVNNYLKSVFTEKIVRYNQVLKIILECDGIVDVDNFYLNGDTENIVVDEICVFYVRQVVTH